MECPKLVDTNDVKKETDEPCPVPEEKIKPSQRPGYAPIKSEYVYILKSYMDKKIEFIKKTIYFNKWAIPTEVIHEMEIVFGQ